jgi:hypothetical protein
MPQLSRIVSRFTSNFKNFIRSNKSLLILVVANSLPQILNVFVFHLISVKLDLTNFNTYSHINYTVNLSAVFILFGQQDLLSRSFLKDDIKVAVTNYAKVICNTLIINLLVASVVFLYLKNDFLSIKYGWLNIYLLIFFVAIDGVNKAVFIVKNKPLQFLLLNLSSYSLYYFLIQNAIDNSKLSWIFMSFCFPSIIFSGLILIFNFNFLCNVYSKFNLINLKLFYFSTINKISIFSYSSLLLVYLSNFFLFAILEHFGEAITIAQFSSYNQLFTLLLFFPNLYQKYIFRKLGSFDISGESESIKKLIHEGLKFIVVVSVFIFVIIFLGDYFFNIFPYIGNFYYFLIFANLILYLFSLAPSGLWLLSNKMNYSFIVNLYFFIILILGILLLVFIDAVNFTSILLIYFFAYLMLFNKTKIYIWKILGTKIYKTASR